MNFYDSVNNDIQKIGEINKNLIEIISQIITNDNYFDSYMINSNKLLFYNKKENNIKIEINKSLKELTDLTNKYKNDKTKNNIENSIINKNISNQSNKNIYDYLKPNKFDIKKNIIFKLREFFNNNKKVIKNNKNVYVNKYS